MKKIRIYPYHWRVSAARDIVDKLIEMGYDALRVYPDRNYKPRDNHLIINWGCSRIPNWGHQNLTNLVNDWYRIPFAIDKVITFCAFQKHGVACPAWTIDKSVAKRWLHQGKCVIARQQVKGHGGEGIVVMEKPEDIVEAPLYTMYKPKKKEFRVHVFNGKVIDFQQKKKRKDANQANSKIRSYDNGWVFCREGVVLPEDAKEESIKAVASLGLHFGGVDVIWNEKENKSYVLEVNSAPGIEGTTVMKYAQAIAEMANK